MVSTPLFNLLQVLVLFPVFLGLSLFVFYLPGFLILSKAKTKLRSDEIIVLGLGLGIIVFLIQGIFSSLIHNYFLTLLTYLAIAVFALKKFGLTIFLPFAQLLKEKFLTLILFLGILVEGFINFPSGFPYSSGHLYWSAQGHDGLWHIVVIEAIKKGFPPQNLLYAGEKIFNYHYFIDIIIATFNEMFPFFSSLDLYFRYFTFLIVFFIGIAVYSFLTTWRKNKTIGLLGVFFTYFVGSFGYIVLAIQGRGFFGGEALFWVSQGNTMIGNPPQAICFALIPAFLLALYHYLQKKERLFFLICCLLSSFLAGFKIYAAVVILAGLGVASLFSLINNRNREIIPLTPLLFLSNFAIFKSITRGGASFLMFQPWWFIRTMIVVPERVNWIDLEHRRQFYLARGGIRSLFRVVQFEATAFLIFLIGNLGTRVIGFGEIFKSFFKKTIFTDPLESTLFFAMITSFLVPLFFIQKGVVYNLIQFMQYFLLIFGFYGAIALYGILKGFKKKTWKYLFLAIFVFLSVPTVIGNLVEFYGKNALAVVTYEEIEALDFLKTIVPGKEVILTKPHNIYAKSLYPSPPWPIYAWDSTGYVSAYTGKQTYYTDEGQMKILGLETEERLENTNDFFNPELPIEDKKTFLELEKIKFIYLRTEEADEKQKEVLSQLGLELIFENRETVIYRVN